MANAASDITQQQLRTWAQAGDEEHGLTALCDVGVNAHSLKPQWLGNAAAAGVSKWLLTGCHERGSLKGQRLCRENQNAAIELRFTAGVHPHDSSSWNASVETTMQQLLSDPNLGAVGETGLDYDRMRAPAEVQKACFAAQAVSLRSLNKREPKRSHTDSADGHYVTLGR